MKSVNKPKVANVRDEFKPIQSHLVVGNPKVVAELEKEGHYTKHPRSRKQRKINRARKSSTAK